MTWVHRRRAQRRGQATTHPVRTYAYVCLHCGADLRQTIATDPPWIMPCSKCGKQARRALT